MSVSMITYRHEAFIQSAVLGVLNQQTNFEFELVLSSDNSPDATDQIIRQILSSHPLAHRVKFIKRTQTLGMIRNGLDNLHQCRGQWIALCEGDDVWSDPLKLQRQIDRLRQNPDCDLCFHPCRIHHGTTPTQLLFGYQGPRQRLISPQDFLEGGCDFCPTAAVVFRKTILEDLPAFYPKVPVGDYFIKLLACLRGGALYLPEPLAVYRRNIQVSWTASTQSLSQRARFFSEFSDSVLQMSRTLEPPLQKALETEIQRQYRDYALNCLKAGYRVRYGWAFARLESRLHPSPTLKTLHHLGRITGSSTAFNAFQRLFVEHPSPGRRLIKRLFQTLAERRLPSPDSEPSPPESPWENTPIAP